MIRLTRIVVPLLACALALVTVAHAATPAERAVDADDGSEPRVSILPARFEPRAGAPGSSLRYTVTVRNTTTEAVTLTPQAIGIVGSPDPEALTAVAPANSRAARLAAWVDYPGFDRPRQLQAGRELEVPAVIAVPPDATPGTHAIGIGVRWSVGALAASGDSSTRVRPSFVLPAVAVIRVPGDTESELRVGAIEAPRLLWRDRTSEFRVRVSNVGNTDLLVDGQVEGLRNREPCPGSSSQRPCLGGQLRADARFTQLVVAQFGFGQRCIGMPTHGFGCGEDRGRALGIATERQQQCHRQGVVPLPDTDVPIIQQAFQLPHPAQLLGTSR